MASISWTRAARRDLESIERHIAEDSAEVAADFVKRLKNAVSRLVDFPESGRTVDLDVPEMREVIFAPYRIFYRFRQGRVVIHAVLHGRRDASREAARRGW